VTPHRLLAYRTEQGHRVGTPPRAVVLGWQASLLERVRSTKPFREIKGPISGPAGTVLELSPGIGFARLPIGAPVAAIAIEELAALGVTTIVGVGAAGALGQGLEVGQTVVCSAALRDEGTSHHYAPSDRWALPDQQLFDALSAALPDAPAGPTWTTDAPYRETTEEIVSYREEGILTVDMEASAVFTVAAVLGLRAAAVFCISDTLHGQEWEPHFHSADLTSSLWRLFETVESTLLASPLLTRGL
jgi:uridine phosphorylase